MEFPLLDRIDAADEFVKLFAYNGYAVSYAAEVEHGMFHAFGAAAGLSWTAAVDQFHERVSFSKKRKMTDKAVTTKLQGSPDLASWQALNERIQDLLGEGRSDRNLVSHNAVHVSIYTTNPESLDERPEDIKLVQEVSQSREHIRRGRNERTVSAREMRAYCHELTQLCLDLNEFVRDVLGCDSSHALRRDRG